jgi:hypothetical protein
VRYVHGAPPGRAAAGQAAARHASWGAGGGRVPATATSGTCACVGNSAEDRSLQCTLTCGQTKMARNQGMPACMHGGREGWGLFLTRWCNYRWQGH